MTRIYYGIKLTVAVWCGVDGVKRTRLSSMCVLVPLVYVLVPLAVLLPLLSSMNRFNIQQNCSVTGKWRSTRAVEASHEQEIKKRHCEN